MANKLLTVAIPAYNVENFIEDTVLSIEECKYSDLIEIIIINDGSSDHTALVCEKIIKRFSNVIVVNKDNGGHGSAINTGIAEANGKYFRLLDGDDWFNTKELDCYISILKNETADIVLTDYVEVLIKSGVNRPMSFYSGVLPEYSRMKMDEVDFKKWGPMLPATTIKTSLLKQAKFHIDEHCYYVDQEYNFLCLTKSKTLAYYPMMIYMYRLERDGQSMERGSLIRNVNSHERVCARLLEEYYKIKDSLPKNKKDYIEQRMIIPLCHMQYQIAIEYCKSRKDFLSFDRILKKYKDFYNHPGVVSRMVKLHRKTGGATVSKHQEIRNIISK